MNSLAGYNTRRKFTIDHLLVDDNLIDFPILVKLSAANFDFTKSNVDGYDIRFTSSDGITLLKYERDRHDSTNQVAEYWVKIPSVSSTVDTEFYIYYRTEDTIDGADPTAVWDGNYAARWSMKDLTTSSIKDSTVNANDGTKTASNEPIEADGLIGKAQQFDGSNDFIDLGNPDSLNLTSNFTLMLWAKVTDLSGSVVPIGKITDYGDKQFSCSIYTTGDVVFDYERSSNNFLLKSAEGEISTNTWYLIGVTVNSNLEINIWKNGLSIATDVAPNEVLQATNPVEIGRFGGLYNSRYFNGLIDEVRISNIARSPTWIKAEYHSGNNTLLTYGEEKLWLYRKEYKKLT